ncbi:sulfotransferase family 2 domain-containing protein [Wenzhouxiangella sp. EGI_FJ10305]|uniref:sulfotransferase family 2 domain-containing protein n=1 Tax=Wenzhouxiangella sp. EGI_FJ10305 TaxID=3243768 RepID=UPI0035DA8477
MIYLEDPNILFLKPFKVAGTSFEIALSKFAGANDIISQLRKDNHIRRNLGLQDGSNYKYSWRERLSMHPRRQLKLLYYKHKRIKFPQHTSAKMARNLLGEEAFSKVFKISIVRDPFDYLISYYFWRNREHVKPRPTFASWIRRNPWVLTHNHQFYYLNGQDIIDYYVRFENLLEDTKKLEKMKPELEGLTQTFSEISAKSSIRPSDATRETMFKDQPLLVEVVRFFQGDHMERFGYHAPPATTAAQRTTD